MLGLIHELKGANIEFVDKTHHEFQVADQIPIVAGGLHAAGASARSDWFNAT